MGLRNILRNKRRGQTEPHKSNGTRTALEIEQDEIDAQSFAISEVSSLGNSVYSDSNLITSPHRRNADGRIVDAVPSKQTSSSYNKRRSKSLRAKAVIYMFPKLWEDRTGTPCGSSEEFHGVDAASVARRKRIFEEDLDADLDWDTTMKVDEDRYRTNGESDPLSSLITCLACV